jgi:Putative Ig domain
MAVPVVTKPADQVSVNGTLATELAVVASNTPTSYKATGLPSGLSINAGTGKIKGTPTKVEVATVVLQAENGEGTSLEVSFKWTVNKSVAEEEAEEATEDATELTEAEAAQAKIRAGAFGGTWASAHGWG